MGGSYKKTKFVVAGGVARVWMVMALVLEGAPTTVAQTPRAGDTEARQRASRALEEVIVTARKREENVQTVPVAVSAMSGEELRRQGVTNTADLSKSVPSLQINDNEANRTFIRGVGQRSGLIRQDPSVSFYLNGVPIMRPDAQLLDTVDLRSIQVLRGPQGTLFGRNNSGGAVVFTMVAPGDHNEGYVEGALGNYSAQRIQGAVGGPMTDRFSARVTLASNRRDGYVDEISDGTDSDSVDRKSAILQTRWDSSEDLSLDTLVYYGETRENLPTVNCRMVNEEAVNGTGIGVLWPGDTDPSNPHAYVDNCNANSTDAMPDLTTNMSPTYIHENIDFLFMAATLEWAFSSNHRLTTIAGFQDGEKDPAWSSNDGGPASFHESRTFGTEWRAGTLELQFSGSLADSRVHYTGGFFGMLIEKAEAFRLLDAIVGIDATSLAALAAGERPDPDNVPPGGTNPPLIAPLIPPDRISDFELEGWSRGLYLQAAWQWTEQLELTLGGRYTAERRDSTLTSQSTDNEAFSQILGSDLRFNTLEPGSGIHSFNGVWAQDPVRIANEEVFPDADGDGFPDVPLTAPTREKKGKTFKRFTPMASLSWLLPESMLGGSFLDGAMFYATWSNGFKSGFFEPRGAEGLQKIDQETVENREVGFKIDAFDRSLRLNVALYSMLYEGLQLITVSVDSEGTLVVAANNAAESRIEGGEMELQWQPAAGWLVTLNYSHNDYTFLEYVDEDLFALAVEGAEQAFVDRSDEPFGLAPERSGSLGLQYRRETEIGTFSPRIAASYKSERYYGLDRGAFLASEQDKDLAYGDAYTLIDARLSWESLDRTLNVAGFVHNVADKRFLKGSVSAGDSLAVFTEQFGAPRMYGVEVRKSF